MKNLDKRTPLEFFKIIIVVMFSSSLVISIEILFNPGTYYTVLIDPIILLRNSSGIVLLSILLKELLLNRNPSNQKIISEIDNMVFIQDCFAWIAIFETRSLSKIKNIELEQLSYLKLFSLELDVRNLCVRVFLYGKSKEGLRKKIIKSKPILDVVLPDLILLSAKDSSKFFDKRYFEEIGKRLYLKNEKQFIFPKFESDIDYSDFSGDELVFCFFPELKNKTEKHALNSQWYSIYNFHQKFFFKGLMRVFKDQQKFIFNNLLKKNNFQRIQVRFHIEEHERHSFKGGISQFERSLVYLISQRKSDPSLTTKTITEKNTMDNDPTSNVLRKTSIFEILPGKRTKDVNPSVTSAKYNFENISSSFEESAIDSIKMNQICFELCNILRNPDFSCEEKTKKCSRRAGFCKKLLKNENFFSIIENILKQNHDEERVHLTTELRRHLSYQQLICILSHLTQLEPLGTFNQKIIEMIYILFKHNLETQENSNTKLNSILPTIIKEKNRRKISPSLTSN